MRNIDNLPKRGHFIVIDGTDGSGKKTQTDLLVEKLENLGYAVETADFPQYGKKSAGLVEEYLNGMYGSADDVGPYTASIFYAADRYDASFQIKKWLAEGKIVISNRYVTANMGHQGGKISNPLERKAYFDWLYNLEYGIFKIPKPDLNIILHVSAHTSQKLVDNKGARDYIGGIKRDIHEANLNHLVSAEKAYLDLVNMFPDFTLLECENNNGIKSKEEISFMIWQEVAEKIGHKEEEFRWHLQDRDMAPNFADPKKYFTPEVNHSIKIERITQNAKIPTRSHATDAGLDLYANDYFTLMPGDRTLVSTGIKLAIPNNYVGLVWDKSGIASTGVHTMAGVIDSGYRGEIKVNIINLSNDIYNIAPGQKIAQLLIQKIELPVIIEDKLDNNTSRGDGGFGSTGLY